jgi:phospholipase C
VVAVVFENRSLDNLLGRLYGPGNGKTFDGVMGKHLTNPIPEWAEHDADRKVVPNEVATDMDSPNPDAGEEYPHTNTQLFNILSEQNRFKLAKEMSAPYNAPAPGQVDDGRLRHRLHQHADRRTGPAAHLRGVLAGNDRVHPDQVPVLTGLARGFGVFDHSFCEVPSRTFTDGYSLTSSGG